MQNEPQLSAEMEKRFDEEFAHLSVLIDQALSYTYVDSKNMGELKIKDIKHFLATALEEQKKKVEVIVKKYAEAEEVIINGQRFLIVDGVEKEFGYPFPDTREKYILKELALLNGKDI